MALYDHARTVHLPFDEALAKVTAVRTAALPALALIAASACSDAPPFWMGMPEAELRSGIAAGDLPDPQSRGAHLVARYCGDCHGIPSPTRHSAGEWQSVARRMDHMASMRGMMRRMPRGMPDVEAPSAAQRREIVDYLEAHALRTVDEATLDPTVEGAAPFAEACSRCHALPDPAQHTAAAWPDVVERMRRNMREMNVPGISDADAAAIVAYLQEYADTAASSS